MDGWMADSLPASQPASQPARPSARIYQPFSRYLIPTLSRRSADSQPRRPISCAVNLKCVRIRGRISFRKRHCHFFLILSFFIILFYFIFVGWFFTLSILFTVFYSILLYFTLSTVFIVFIPSHLISLFSAIVY